MFNSTILDVAIGMIFVYLLMSLLCSAANELIELVLKRRARELENGIGELLTNQRTQNFLGRLTSWIKGIAPRLESWVKGASTGTSAPSGVVADLYNHSLINGLFKGKYEVGSRRLPAYIPATNFALALMDLVPKNQTGPPAMAPASLLGITSPPSDWPNSLTELRDAVANLSGDYAKVKNALLPLIDAAGNDAAKARQNIETWYNSAMDRVSGWYKRRAQIIIFFLGLIVAVALNVDSVIVAKRLSTDKSLRDSLVAAADDYAKANANASPASSPSPTNSVPKSIPPATTPKPTSSPNPTPTPQTQAKVTAPAAFMGLLRNYAETATYAAAKLAVLQPQPSLTPSSERSNTKPIVDSSPSASPTSSTALVSPSRERTATPETPPVPFYVATVTLTFRDYSVTGPMWFAIAVTIVFLVALFLLGRKIKQSKSDWKLLATGSVLGVTVFVVFLLLFVFVFGVRSSGPGDRTSLQPTIQPAGPSPTQSNSPTAEPSPTSSAQTPWKGTNGTRTPSPSPLPSPSASPAKPTNAALPSPTTCWEEACKADKDSPQCKLKKNQCELAALSLPIGWMESSEDIHLQWPGSHWKRPGGWWDQIAWHWLGWLLTALAISLGAPFWFDMLNKIIVVRSTVKPKEKSGDEPSKS